MATADKPATPAAPAKGGAKGGGADKGKKGKDKTVTGLKQPNSGVKFGHGAKNRPDRAELRARERAERLAARAKSVAAGGLQTDDEELQSLYDLVNKKQIDYKGIDEKELTKPLPPYAERGGEELWQRHDTMRASTFDGAFVIPKELQGKVQVVRDNFDALAQTDLELSEDEVEAIIKDGDDSDSDLTAKFEPSRSTGKETIDLVNNYAEAHVEKLQQLLKHGGQIGSRTATLQGREIISALNDLRRKRSRQADGVEFEEETTPGREQRGEQQDEAASLDPRAARQARRVKEAKAAAHTIAGLLADSDEEQPSGAASTRRTPSSVPVDHGKDGTSKVSSPSTSASADAGYESAHSRTFLLDESDGEIVPYPALPTPRASKFFVRGEGSAAAENNAMLDEQTHALMGKNVKRSASSILSGDDSSDWGGDDADPRYRVDPIALEREYRRMHNIGDSDSDNDNIMELGVDAAGSRINAAFGDGIHKIPDAVLQELASPYDFAEHVEGKPYPDAETVREAEMTPEERILDEQRKKLRDLIERPLPLVSRPLWPLHALVAAVDQVQQVVKGGMIASTRCMIVVGNEHGGAGFGMGKHKEPFMATKQALANAQRDMIHVSLHKRQLYHDLIGKHNNLYVILRTMPGTAAFNNAPPLLQDIFDIVGIDNVSAKIVGSRRREPYQVVQALFDGFHHHKAPESEAFARGLRMQWMGADRHNPRNVYPFAPRGPRYPSASERWVKGRARA